MEEELEKIYKIGKVDGRIDYVSQKIEASNKRFWIWKSKLLMLQAIQVNPMANHFRYQVLKKKTTVDVIYIYNLVHTID